MTTQCVQVKLELGHRATIRSKPTQDGFTHDWTMFVRGPESSSIEHFVDKIVFHLHESFPKPKRVVKEPPYQVSQSGYAGFEMAIDVYFRNKEDPKKVRFYYDLFLHVEGQPPVNHIRCEKLTFRNPTEDFRRKLLKAGGVGVLPMDVDISTIATPKLNTTTSTKPSVSSATPATDPSAFTKGKPQSAAAAAASSSQGSKKPKSLATSSSSLTTSSSSSLTPKESGKSTPKTKEAKESLKQKTSSKETTKAPSKDSKAATKDIKTTISKPTPSPRETKPSPSPSPKPSPRPSSKEPKPSIKEPKPSTKEPKPSAKVSSKDIKSSSESGKSSTKGSSKVKDSGSTKRPAPDQSPKTSTPAKKRKQSSSKEDKQKDEPSQETKPSTAKQSSKTKAEKGSSGQSSSSSEKGSKSKAKTSKPKKESTTTPSTSSVMESLFVPEITKSKAKPKKQQKQEPEPKKELPPFDAELSTEELDDAHSPSSSISFSSLTLPSQGGGTGTLKMLMQDLEGEDTKDDDDADIGRPFPSSGPPIRHHSMSSDSNSRHSSPSPDIEKQIEKQKKTSFTSKKTSTVSKKVAKTEKKPKGAESKIKSSHNSNIDYLYELVDLHKRLMKLTDREKLQQVVDLIGETGSFKVTDTTFDFDLCSLDKSTVRRLQDHV